MSEIQPPPPQAGLQSSENRYTVHINQALGFTLGAVMGTSHGISGSQRRSSGCLGRCHQYRGRSSR